MWPQCIVLTVCLANAGTAAYLLSNKISVISMQDKKHFMQPIASE